MWRGLCTREARSWERIAYREWWPFPVACIDNLPYSFGKPRAATERELATVSRLANPDEPYYARFIFRYHPEGMPLSCTSSRGSHHISPYIDLLRVQGIIPSDAPAAGPSEQSTSARKRPIDRSRSDTPEEAGPSRKRVKTEERALVGEEEDADALELEVELKAIHARARAIEEKLRARAGVAQLKHEPESSNVMIDETRERVDREGSLTRLHTVLAG